MSAQQPPKKRYDADELDEHGEPHVDERWLISYADMMTLLFGFFVMLYSMSNPDQVKPDEAAKMQASINAKFAAPPAATPLPSPTPGVEQKPADSPTVVKAPLPSRNETGNAGDTPGDRPGEIPVKTDPVDGRDPNSKQEARDEGAGSNPVPKGPDYKALLTASKVREGKLKKELAEAQAAAAAAKTHYEESDRRIVEIQAQLQSLNEDLKAKGGPLNGEGENKRSFISTIIQWETEKHDVDMIVVHPSGKRFSYKNRTYKGLTGNFILDSRQGPGMEVWQDSMLTAGRYEVHARLYNDYGNRKPAIVKGSILTVKGRVDLPQVELTMKQNPEAVYIFNVDKEGNVSLESK